jgi:hypothetical protein
VCSITLIYRLNTLLFTEQNLKLSQTIIIIIIIIIILKINLLAPEFYI